MTVLPSLTLGFTTCWIAVSYFSLVNLAFAKTILVGPNQAIKTPAQSALVAENDDVIEIASGTYTGDVAVWTQRRLTIRGVGARPVLMANGKDAQGKGIWVFRDGNFTVENLEFRGARVAEGNGAAIRLQAGRLHVINCAFFDNQMGILTHDAPTTQLIVEGSAFGQAPAQASPLPHLVYAGKIALLRVIGSRFHGGHFGHLLKSRARVSDIRYNLLVDGPGGRASYEAEFPNGGDVTLVGNVLGQSSTTENPTLLAYGAAEANWPVNRLTMVHNTLYSEGLRPAWFLHVFREHFATPPEVLTRNNLVVGAGLFTMGVTGQHQGNYFAPANVLGDPAAMDFRLDSDSWLRGRVNPVPSDAGDLQPRFEQWPPGRLSPIQAGSKLAPGAIQAPTLARP